MDTHKILGIKKLSFSHHWYELMTTEGFLFTVYDTEWVVDETVETPIFYIVERDKENTVNKCKIIGKSEHVGNLLSDMGWSLPNRPSSHCLVRSIEDVISDFKYSIWEFESVLKKNKEDNNGMDELSDE